MKTEAYRLRGEAAFATLFAQGRRLTGRHVQLLAMTAAHDPGRLGFVIGRKAIGRAVDRNRLRRRVREAVRVARPRSAAYDLIFRVRAPIARDELEVAAEEGAVLLQRLLSA